ncbi:uncharacterized protein METZ01_LOCUS352821, partial [marine metagenome]
MSNIGKQPIIIPDGVKLIMTGHSINVKGKLGELNQDFHPSSNISVNEEEVIVSRNSDERQQRELHGLNRVLIANMIEGVSAGFKKELHLVGVGYSVDASKGEFII